MKQGYLIFMDYQQNIIGSIAYEFTMRRDSGFEMPSPYCLKGQG
jgi:hypothetical protein